MTYAQPEINTIGKANQLIQVFQKDVCCSTDTSAPFDANPAYDLDE